MFESFSLVQVNLRQYRSIEAAEVELSPLTLFVGPNGSGKSNFLDALRLTSEALTGGLDQALRSRGGIGEVRRRSTGHPTHFTIEIAFRGAGFDGWYCFTVAAVRGGGYRVSRETCDIWLDENGAKGDRHGDRRYAVIDGVVSWSEPVLPPANDKRLYLVAAAGLPAFQAVFDGLSGISVFNIVPDVMRRPAAPDPGDVLARDGANIASVVR
ncbi:AAA family ATPase [Tsukamurella soli]|uniref:Endonuclease GajA/Old nuclease/RecF-like AAA domain-containing protein n=1 Tax=Tsukamurella soli TaxID=644556 RepID=A0ABP8K599_9ACTN